MVKKMTDRQSKRLEILSRIDELDRLEARTTDQITKALIKQRKAELRNELQAL